MWTSLNHYSYVLQLYARFYGLQGVLGYIVKLKLENKPNICSTIDTTVPNASSPRKVYCWDKSQVFLIQRWHLEAWNTWLFTGFQTFKAWKGYGLDENSPNQNGILTLAYTFITKKIQSPQRHGLYQSSFFPAEPGTKYVINKCFLTSELRLQPMSRLRPNDGIPQPMDRYVNLWWWGVQNNTNNVAILSDGCIVLKKKMSKCLMKDYKI